ncbi:MAG TPA: enoyl-CoA hydratase/isomerase family protein, partial [Acidimicrobiales bacterium]|nr:enoyl-CoA hydratase/isomerase family protein [Acidimicrobiales bacterium]
MSHREPSWILPFPPGRGLVANAVIDRIEEMLKSSIAVIDGLCTTGALELALGCDLRMATETATLCDWHLRTFGNAIGGWGSATRLARTVGTSKAKELLLTGREVSGLEAYEIGLVNRAVPSSRLMDEGLEWASAIAAMRPEGVRLTLGFLALQEHMDTQEALGWARRVPDLMQ